MMGIWQEHFASLCGFCCSQLCFLCSLRQFFERAREMEFFKSIIQIPELPDVSNGFRCMCPVFLKLTYYINFIRHIQMYHSLLRIGC